MWNNDHKKMTPKKFWARVDQSGGWDSCWPWTGTFNTGGYGKLKVHQKDWTAHRYAMYLSRGSLPPKSHILHSCHNRACCNPAHLKIGDHILNMKDKADHGSQKGSKNHASRFTEEHILMIRALKMRGFSLNRLGRLFQTTASVISNIVKRRTWSHL